MRVNWASSLALLFPTLVSATPAASLSKREIDPFGEIECRGVVPLWLMPPSLLPNEMVEPHYTGLHDFCASELYGGSSIANVGVFCMGRASMPTLAFDVINSHDQLHSPRLQLYCRSHCRCKYVDEGYGHREVPLHQVQRVFVRAPLVYNLDIYHGTGAWRDPTIPNSALELGIPLLITVDAAILQPIDHNTVIPIFVIPEIGYSMTCEGPVHPLLVPHEFQTLLANELCCTRSLGGSRLGNTGGMCVSQPDGSLQTVFLDELSHPKLQPWNFPLGISVRTICGQICRCDPLLPTQAARAEYELATADLISRLSLYGMSRGRGPGNVKASESRGDVGQIVAYMGGGTNRGNGGAPGPYANADGGVVYKGMQIVPKGGFSDANRPKDFETPWPQGLALPGDPEPVKVNDDELLPTKALFNDCRGRCSGPSGCGAGCLCTARRPGGEAGTAGLDPVFPVAGCVIAALVQSSMGRMGSRVTLGKRVMSGTPCVCNVSYISAGCCSSSDGLIWEDGRRLGRLNMSAPDL